MIHRLIHCQKWRAALEHFLTEYQQMAQEKNLIQSTDSNFNIQLLISGDGENQSKMPDLHLNCRLFSLVQFSHSLYDPMNPSTPGLSVHHQLPEFTQTHGRRVSDTIQPSHSLSSPSPPAHNPSQHQNLFE